MSTYNRIKESKVIDSRCTEKGRWRRREDKGGTRFTTMEILIEESDTKEKVINEIKKYTGKLLSNEDINDIEKYIYDSFAIDRLNIFKEACRILIHKNPAAFVLFMSYKNNFSDINDFKKIITKIGKYK